MENLETKNYTSVTSINEPRVGQPTDDRDGRGLQRMGKKPVLQRNFGILSILGFSCTLLGTWEGLLGTFIRPLENGGSGGTVYAFLFGWMGTAATFVGLSELVSMAPTAGGQYHWAAMLAPAKHQRILSYITGWFAVLGWQTTFAACAFLAGTMIQGAAVLGSSAYHSLSWHGTLLAWASIGCAFVANMVSGKLLPRIETTILVLHILGFFGIVIPVAYMSDHKTQEEVFRQFSNRGGFPTQGLSWFVGMTSCAFSFAGGDAAVHMAEEVANASRVIPRAMMLSVVINGCLGFGMLMVALFCQGDLRAAIASPTGYPFMEMFYEATNSIPGALAMCSIVLIIQCSAVIGVLAAASRQLWSFARDKGVPGWQWWKHVSHDRNLPTSSITLTVLIGSMLALINLGSSVALDDVLSMAVSGLYLSYLVVLTMLLYRRVKGDISACNDGEHEMVNVPGAKLVWGSFYCPGVCGILVNTLAVIYTILVVFFSFWPSKMSPSVSEMNWSIVGIGGTSTLAMVYYFIRARHVYTGPVMEVMAPGPGRVI